MLKEHFINFKCQGELIDEFIVDDEVVESYSKEFNVIVSDFLKLVSGLLKDPSNASPLYFANGVGLPSWDTVPYVASTSGSKLVSELYRKEILPENITYLDALGNSSTTPTNRIQLQATFDYLESNGDLREAAIFGLTASSAKDSGIMMNHKIHAKRPKDSSKMLRRIFRFTFDINN